MDLRPVGVSWTGLLRSTCSIRKEESSADNYGHIFARCRPIHLMFGSTVRHSRSADRMALFPVSPNLRWRLSSNMTVRPPSWKIQMAITLRRIIRFIQRLMFRVISEGQSESVIRIPLASWYNINQCNIGKVSRSSRLSLQMSYSTTRNG